MTTPLHRPNPGDDERGPLPGALYLPQLRPERSKCEVCGESTGSVHGKRCSLGPLRRHRSTQTRTLRNPLP